MPANIYDVIIIGGGPAGMTAGIYVARKKLNTLIVSRDFVGQMGKAVLVENFPGFKSISGLELIGKMKEQLKNLGITIKEGKEARKVNIKKDGSFEVEVGKEKYETKAIIITTGRDPRPLEVPGEKEFIGKGVSYCVTCDGPLFYGKTVAVVGGGNSAFQAAFELAERCPKVYILEAEPKVRADEILREKAKSTGKIEIITDVDIKEIKGTNFVEKIIYKNNENKKIEEIEVAGVFVEIGSIPATGFVKGLVDFNKADEIIIDPQTCATKTPGIFAAGDVTDIKYKQIIVASGEGAKAALSTYEYLKNNEKF